MAHKLYSVLLAPVGYLTKIILCEHFGAYGLEHVSCFVGVFAYVIPECGIEQNRVYVVAVHLGKIFVEIVGPHACAFDSVCGESSCGPERRLVVEGGGDGAVVKVLFESLVVFFVGYFYEAGDRLFAEVVHTGASFVNADKRHETPSASAYGILYV